ncbi:MAG: hypothetical protein JW795_22625, partial [Chitinivibrionales bacterium]|nr:hypothetical protein [Chitinivibrionales bacterium]
SRVTYSATMLTLNPDDRETVILAQLDTAGLGHNTFTEQALALIIRSADGFLRRVRNLCLSCLLEALRALSRSIDIEIVNKVLIQPHWRNDFDLEAL